MKGESKAGVINNKKAVLKLSFVFLAILVLVGIAIYAYVVVANAVVTTDKADYSPGETVLISGTGFSPDTQITVSVTRPDSSVDSGTTTSDSNGAFTYNYQLNGIAGTYTVVASDGNNNAQITFTDSTMSVNSVKLNGGNSVTVCPNASITVSVNVTLSGRDWHGTEYKIGSPSNTAICTNVPEPDIDNNGNYVRLFNVTAPSSPGSYGFYLKISEHNSCGPHESNQHSMPNSITVQTCGPQQVCGNNITEGNEQCDGGACCNANCTFKSPSVQCRAGNGICDPAEYCTGQSATCPADAKAPQGTQCDDGLFCNVGETCNGAGQCTGGSARTCNDQDSCTLDSCDEGQDRCVNTFSDLTGPVTSNLTAKKINGLCQLTIEALETDICSNISAAEYFLGGASCGPNGTGTAMNVKDGNWNSKIEEVIKNNVIASDGNLNIHVRGMDLSQNWGACKTIQVNVDCIAPGYPTCTQGGIIGILVNGVCNADELLVCGNDPLIKANICDSQSRIQLAEYFIDEDCDDPQQCLGWHGINMTSSDGLYDELCEDVQAVVDLDPLSEGTHYIELHGKDGQENWGKWDFSPRVSFIKDTSPPESTKTIGDAKIECDEEVKKMVDNPNCYYIRQDTPITITCEDPDPQQTGEFAGGEKLYYRQRWKYDFNSGWGAWGQWTIDSDGNATIYKTEDSIHELEYYCVDACNNNETHHFEIDIVDSKAPITAKTVGEPKVPCGQGENCDYYITQQTPITLNCTDQQPHPINEVTLYYRDYLDGQQAPNYTAVQGGYVTIYKQEDSRHILQWYCKDVLGNYETPRQEIDVVDTVPPVINKTIIGPYYGDCPPQGEEDECYIDGITQIQVTAVDPQPHPVNRVACYWWYEVDDERHPQEGYYTNFPINFPEESRHELYIVCEDALGNPSRDYEVFLVDKTPPTTLKRYGEPFFTNQISEWITSQTPIYLTADDGQSEHASGVAGTFWRNTIVDNAYCENTELCQQATGTGNFTTYTEPFTKPRESCHLIEYYSKDRVGKTEQIKKQCVFVDNSAPDTDKEIGLPRYTFEYEEDGLGELIKWNGWYVTSQTPVTLTCTDPQPHPVDHEKLCYKISWEVQEQTTYPTEDYCTAFGGEMNDGYCCADVSEEDYEFNFLEESLHNIEWYCEDVLGNKGNLNLEYDNVDNEPPTVIIHNPSMLEAEGIARCDQSIVVEVYDLKSGVNISTIYAELYYENGTAVLGHKVYLKKAVYHGTKGDIYEGLMDKQLPPGTYTLKVYAKDNLGTQQIVNRQETLKEGLYVEYLDPASCLINVGQAKTCIFTFHICARNITTIDMCMYKLGENPGLITPDMLNAMISKNNETAYVGLCEVSDAEDLDLKDGQKVNGKETFNLSLTFTSNITSILGTGNYDLNYTINAWDP